MKHPRVVSFLLPLALVLACESPKPSALETLQAYQGAYEYLGDETLELIVSELDTTLYAVIDQAKYPLTLVGQDSFLNLQQEPVVFVRDETGALTGYRTSGQVFRWLSKAVSDVEMLPRRALLGAAGDYVYRAPERLADGLAVGTLQEAFNQPEPILDMVKETIAGSYPDVHTILIYRRGKLVLEEYFYGFERDQPHQLRSAGKALKSGLLGLAIEQGYVGSEQDPLLPYFKAAYPAIANVDERKQRITIADFLRYRHGMDCENDNPNSAGSEVRMMQAEDWVKHTLDLPMVADPGESSSYCTGCSLVINGLVERAVGEPIEDFAKRHLFGPLGITDYDWAFEPNPTSIATFNQLYLTPRDMLKLAIMYKDGGAWQGQQILSSEWVEKTFTADQGDYGYFWLHKYFVVDGVQYDSYLATGNGGQKINIWPQLDMITIFTGGNYNSYALYGTSTPPNRMIPAYILKAIQEKG